MSDLLVNAGVQAVGALADRAFASTNEPKEDPSISRIAPDVHNFSTGLGAPAQFMDVVAMVTPPMPDIVNGLVINIRNHPRILNYLSMYSVVHIRKVECTIVQLSVPEADETQQTRVVKFGLLPRDTPYVDPQDNNVVGLVPHQQTIAFGPSICSQRTVCWGEGGLPFPPGLQLDLRAVETRHNYVNFGMGLLNPKDAVAGFELCMATLNITIGASGIGFGSMY